MSYILSKLIVLPGILLAITVHEFAHALAAVKLGDDTPIKEGRLSLDPLKHLDPIGFLCLLLVGFGWAKPVMIDSRNFKNPRRDDIIVSVAGPMMNFIMAFILMGIIKLIYQFATMKFLQSTGASIIVEVLTGAVSINLVLMVFNLIPIPPLDGHHILGNIVGAPVWNFYYKYYDQLRFVMILLILFNIVSKVIGPIVMFLYTFLFNIYF